MKYSLVAIGVSMGSLDALGVIVSSLPADFSLPIAIVSHRDASSGTNLLREILSEKSKLDIIEAEDKMPIAKGKVVIAPSDYHLLLEDNHWALSTEAPVNNARPSINAFFESVVDVLGNKVIGIILTGASDDGAEGLRKIQDAGGVTLIQSSATSYAEIMPKAAMDASPNSQVLNLWEIGPHLLELSHQHS